MRPAYLQQVQLLVKTLPFVAKEKVFALKGGTAINLFYRELPRLSVDIDLVYLPINSRAEALQEINDVLDRIAKDIAKNKNGVRAQRIDGGGGGDTRVLVRANNATIKIEVSPVTRGVVTSPIDMRIQSVVENEFGFVETQVVSFEDLYAGKLVAALDRQHPRDLFDVKLLLENEGITDDLFRVFLVYLICSSRPMHELIEPKIKNISTAYEREFNGMSSGSVSLSELQVIQRELIKSIRNRIDSSAANFLRNIHNAEPDFTLIALPQAQQLPAVQWKLANLQNLKSENPAKHRDQFDDLERLLDNSNKV